jgi:hypothetical protein
MRTLALLALLLLPQVASAQRRVTVPLDVGVGPAAYFISGPVYRDQPLHTGVKISLQAVLDRAWLRRNQAAIPRSYRKQAQQVEEIRISPSLFIPDALIISPKVRDTGLYGLTWRPLGLNVPLATGRFSLNLGAGLLLTYAYLFSDTLDDTHFLRPGLDLGARAEVELTQSFLVSAGWSSGLYIPQKLGSFGTGPLSESMFHLGQAHLQLHVRFPYTTRL